MPSKTFIVLILCGAVFASADSTRAEQTKAEATIDQPASPSQTDNADAGNAQSTPANFRCSYDKMRRRIEIHYETQAPVPCRVMYFKQNTPDGEWLSQLVWNSQNEIGYCESRAEEFVGKHRNWGWDCQPFDRIQ